MWRMQNNKKKLTMLLGVLQMTRKTIMVTALLITASSLAQAQDWHRDASAVGGQGDDRQWRTFAASMSPSEYRRAVRDNHKLVRNVVKSYSSEALSSAGVPRAGIALMGAAAGLAIDGDAKWHLNESKTLAFEFDDVVDEDRALMFTIKKAW